LVLFLRIWRTGVCLRAFMTAGLTMFLDEVGFVFLRVEYCYALTALMRDIGVCQ
jgi:hypothetical protein